MKSRFHRDALIEFDEAIDYYSIESEDLGVRFRSCIRASVQRIENSPSSWPFYEGDVRRFVVNDFPFVIIYLVLDDYLYIVAVMHTSRKPGYWKSRIN